MKRSTVLIVDAVINLVLGILLLMCIPFPDQIVRLLGVPEPGNRFYASIMGGVFIGITIALLMESSRKEAQGLVGLGLGGAAAINICGGLVLMGWLVFGNLRLPAYGQAFLWLIAVALVGISIVELFVHRKPPGG